MEPDKLLKIEDAASYLGVSSRTLRRYLSIPNASGLKFLVLNPDGKRRNIRIATSELEAFVSRNMGYMKTPQRAKRVYNREANYKKYARKKKPVRRKVA